MSEPIRVELPGVRYTGRPIMTMIAEALDATEPRWIWVSLPYATFALIVKAGRIVEAAPIAQWAVGKDEHTVAAYYRQRGATFRDLAGQEDT